MYAHYSDANLFNLLEVIKSVGGNHNRAVYGYEIEMIMLNNISRAKLGKAMQSARKAGLIDRTEVNHLFGNRYKLTARGEVLLRNACILYDLYGLFKEGC